MLTVIMRFSCTALLHDANIMEAIEAKHINMTDRIKVFLFIMCVGALVGCAIL